MTGDFTARQQSINRRITGIIARPLGTSSDAPGSRNPCCISTTSRAVRAAAQRCSPSMRVCLDTRAGFFVAGIALKMPKWSRDFENFLAALTRVCFGLPLTEFGISIASMRLSTSAVVRLLLAFAFALPVNAWATLPSGTPYKILVFSKTAGFRHASIPNAIAAIQQLGIQNNFQV